MSKVSHLDKYLPEDGSIPPRAKYTCKTCKMWLASNTGRVGHEKRFPGHVLVNVKTGYPVGQAPHYSKRLKAQLDLGIRPTLRDSVQANGHSVQAEIPTALLEYAFSKMRQTIESELDRLHDQIIPASPEPGRKNKFYVAR
jgi:hypothetical protein